MNGEAAAQRFRSTPPRTASRHNAPFQVEQNRNMAAMRWRGLLGDSGKTLERKEPCQQAYGPVKMGF
jgi:hypothetical protein